MNLQNKNKCAVLSLISAAAAVLAAAAATVFVCSEMPFQKGIFPVKGLEGIFLNWLYIAVLWELAMIVAVLSFTASMMFLSAEEITENGEMLGKLASELTTSVVIISAAALILGGISFILGIFLSAFILTGTIIIAVLPFALIFFSSLILAIRTNIESGEFFGF